MSYSKFLDELNDFYKDRHERGIVERPTLEEAQIVVRDNWLRSGRIDELISFILENWDSGNCDEFIKPLVKILIKNKETKLFKRLWKGILRFRTEKLWRDLSFLRKHLPQFQIEDLSKIDLSNFNQFSSKRDIRQVVAFQRAYTLNGISEFMSGLKSLDQVEEIERARQLYESVYSMQRPIPKPSSDKRKIDERVFWELIEQSRQGVTDKFEFLVKLKARLETFKPSELRKFQKLLLIKQQELNRSEHWALAYIVRRGCGDDEFDYFRVWAVSKGQVLFEAIKKMDNVHLGGIFDEDPQLEELLYLAEIVYENKTGELMKRVKVKPSKLIGELWTEERIAADFPILCELFDFPN